MPLEALGSVLPVFLIAAVGYALGKRIPLDVSSISRICLYILTPVLTFNSLANSTVDLQTVGLFSTLALVGPIISAFLLSAFYRQLGWEKDLARSMLLPTVFSNTGNFGLPICLFAFGQGGMELAVVYMVIQSFLIASLGVFIAASSNLQPKEAVRRALKMPALYGALLGVIVKLANINIPQVLARPIELLSQATIPMTLLVLGLQLVKIESGYKWQIPGIATVARLILIPAAIALVGRVLGLRGLAWKILVLQSAMPSPVNATILAGEFNANPDLISQTTLLSTIASLATLSGWIVVLNWF